MTDAMKTGAKAVRRKDMLIVEDERVIADGYGDLFADQGYSVRIAATGNAAVREFERKRPDVVFLDIMLPDGNGYDVCRKMRELDSFVPIVFSTVLDGPGDIERGLEAGGDDYVLKTDSDRVRIARVARAVARYDAFMARRAATAGATEIRIGSVTVDTARLTIVGGRKRGEMLTRTEADILSLLDTDRTKVFSVEEIVSGIRGEGFACNDNIIYVHMFHIREKLGKAASDRIVNVHRTGYQLKP